MYEGNLVICDKEKQYSRNLLQMFARNRESKVQMFLFHTMEELEKFSGQKTIQILLIDREYPLELREKIPAEKKFVLVKNQQDALSENEEKIYRYQSAEAIWLQIQNGEVQTEIRKKQTISKMKKGGKEEKIQTIEKSEKRKKVQIIEESERIKQSSNLEKTQVGKESKNVNIIENKNLSDPEITDKILDKSISRTLTDIDRRNTVLTGLTNMRGGSLIGVYSPIHRIGKTKFAMELGKEFAKKEPVLYMNLEEYAGGDFYFHDQTGQTLADLLYYARQERGNLGLRISMMAGQDEDLDYILPMPYAQDLQEVCVEEWLKLFNQILENCIYGKIILDLGDSIKGLFQILETCDTVYTPFIEDGAARAKLNQYTENLRKTGKEKVLEKTIQKKMQDE